MKTVTITDKQFVEISSKIITNLSKEEKELTGECFISVLFGSKICSAIASEIFKTKPEDDVAMHIYKYEFYLEEELFCSRNIAALNQSDADEKAFEIADKTNMTYSFIEEVKQ